MVVTITVVSLLLLQTAHGYTFNDVVNLKARLFQNYDASIRPIFNQSEQIQVNISLSLRSILDLDITNGYLETIGYIVTTWKDEKLSWVGTEYAEIPRLNLNDEIWDPSVGLLDSMSSNVGHTSLSVFPDGTVLKIIGRKFSSVCELNMRLYPKDRHVCKYEFMSVKYHIKELRIKTLPEAIDLSSLSGHGEWTIENIQVTETSLGDSHGYLEGSQVIYAITLERQPEFSVLHKTLPLIVLVISSLAIHIVPLNSGERVSYSVTVLLAFVFWQAVVSEELPNNSSKLSLFSIIISTCLFGTGIFTLESVVLSRIVTFGDERRIPHLLQALARKILRKGQQETASRNMLTETKSANEVVDDKHNGTVEASNLEDNLEIETVGAIEDSKPPTWPEVAHALDILMHSAYIVLTLLLVVVYILIFTL